MILSKLWEKYLFFETLKFLVFFLISIFAIYVIIDFSTFSTKFFTYSSISFIDILAYYINLFIKYTHLFLPLTLMLAIIKVLCDMNVHNELTALRVSGISTRMLSRPFFIIAIFLTIFTYLNFEFFSTDSLNDHFKKSHLKKEGRKKNQKANVIYLEDGTKLIYQSSNLKAKELFDVFWIKSSDDIWHIKYLQIIEPMPIGYFVDHLQRNLDNKLEKATSYNEHQFDTMIFDENNVDMLIPYENRSITNLFEQLLLKKVTSPKENAEIVSQLNYKLSMPLLSIIIVLAIIPFCIKFSKNVSIFYICTFSIFAFVIFFMLVDAVIILGENQVFTPWLIIWLPFVLTSVFFMRRFLRH